MSGSKWLADTLNKHPEIFCSHSAGQLQIYGRQYSDQELEDILQRERLQFSGEYSLTTLFQSVSQNTNKTYAGNVHAFRLDRFMEAKQKQNFDAEVRVANLIRHPIAVTLSRQAMFLNMCRYDEGVRERMRNGLKNSDDTYAQILRGHQADQDDMANLCFLDAVKGLKRLSDEVADYSEVLHVQVERLSDQACFKSLIRYLASDEVDVSDAVILPLVASEPTNQHARGEETLTDRLKVLAPWKKEVLAWAIESTGIVPNYRDIGYTDFDVVLACLA